MNNFAKQLTRVKDENIVWIIYLFVIIFNFISNKYERDYLMYKNIKDKKIYKTINKTLVIVLFLLYIYFLSLSIEDLKDLNSKSTIKEIKDTRLSVITNILFLVGGAIVIYLTYTGADTTDVDEVI